LTGFSDKVSLGSIGRIQQSDEVVMRVRVETNNVQSLSRMRWRGIALDEFDNRTWSQSKKDYREPYIKGDKDFFLLDFSSGKAETVIQTFYLEPIDTSVLFTLSRPLAVQGNFQLVRKDAEGGISFPREAFERVSYKVYSDRYVPPAENLRRDSAAYSAEEFTRYLQLPKSFDKRITALAAQVTSGKGNRYDKAKAIEEYLQTQFGYTLEQKAGGDEPVADFLFNVREGHCEYFSTAMAMMLRTQGIAARVVNGFQQGEYNETADVFVVRQKDAHSWVEVYFPRERAWVTFDPTPYAGQNLSSQTDGILGGLGKYLEALETFWIQYFVAFDNQEQRSLFRSVKNGFVDFQAKLAEWLTGYQAEVQDWWREVRGDKGVQASLWAVAYGAIYLFLLIAGFYLVQWLYRRLKPDELWSRLLDWLKARQQKSIVEFYERMQKVLARRGFRRDPHQTPLEFAFALEMPEAVRITEKYNRVRFGEKNLTGEEAREIESWLKDLENSSSAPGAEGPSRIEKK
jgi:protein-glutamine gamma-glutamyltransferase